MEENKKQKISKSDIAVWKWIYNICRAERFKVILLIFTNVISAVLTIAYANFSKKIINAAATDHSFKKVIYYAVCYLILIVVQMSINLVSRSTTERCKGKLEWDLKQYMLKTVIKKDYLSVTSYHTGELQNRMFNDVTIISDGFTTIFPDMIHLIVKLICAFGYLVVIDKIFAFIFLIGGIIVFLLAQTFRKTLKRLHKEVQATEGKTRSFIQEVLTSLLVIKTFVVEDKISENSDELQSINYKAKMKRRFFGIVANAGINLVFNLGYVFALAFGAYRLINGLDYGTVTAMLQLVNQIQSPFASLSNVMPKYFALIASAERLMEIESLPDEDANNDEDIVVSDIYNHLKSIEFNNISFKYDRDIILDNTSLSVNKGDFVAIMGISGIGKSTLLKLLLGVFNVYDGSIELQLDDKNIPIDYHTRRLFSYVPQGNFLLSGTIRDNLLFINQNATDDEIQEAIRISCADKFINELPQGLDTVIGERGIGLSEGQLQRLAIARSLLSNSPVMLLDEATSALDEDTEKEFLTNLKLLENKTCIIVSHKRAALEICNKHIQIVDSKIVVEEK
jgi:ATP-binding cassette subfamily B protein